MTSFMLTDQMVTGIPLAAIYDNLAVGVDKITLSTIRIARVDWSKFENHPGATIKLAVDRFKRTISGRDIRAVEVKGDKFRFSLDVAPNKNGDIPYELMELNPAAILYGNNVRNIADATELQRALDTVKTKLWDDFGLEVDLTEATLRKVEVNRNIPLDHQFAEYGKVLDFIKDVLPSGLRKGQRHNDNAEHTGFKVANKDRSLKVYDKDREAKIVIDEPGRLMRVEYGFTSSRKIEAEFGSILLADLLANFHLAAAVWFRNVEADILKRIPDALNNERKRHAKKLQLAMAMQPKAYIDKWLSLSQAIFDVELLREVLRKALANTTDRNIRERLKMLNEAVTQRQDDESEHIFGQLQLLDEIAGKLQYRTQ